ncbi:MAG: YveK family protein [Acutalibacteraceae bacterium]
MMEQNLDNTQQSLVNKEMLVDFGKIFRIIKKRIVPMVLCVLIFTATFFVGAKFLVPKKYTSTEVLYITTKTQAGSVYEGYNGLAYTLNATDTFVEMLKTNNFFDLIASYVEEKTGEYTLTKDISKMVSYSVEEDIALINVSVTDEDPKRAYIVAKGVAKIAPTVIDGLRSSAELKVVNKPTKPYAPSSPNLKKYVVLGFMFGMLLCVVYIIYKYFTDNIIRKEDEIESLYDMPVIAYIPEYSVGDFGPYKIW